MAYRKRIKYSEAQLKEVWDRWQRGETLNAIGRVFERPSSSIFNLLAPTGGIRPQQRKRSSITLTLYEREEISRGIAKGYSMREIANYLERAPSTICREINRNGGYYQYRATESDNAAWERAKRPKPCKLGQHPTLAKLVAKKLKENWSPKQIDGWLKRIYPDDEHHHVSHETIYKTLFIQARGALKKELQLYLRTQRAIRRAKQHSIIGV